MKDGSVSDLSLSQYIQSSLQVDDLSLSNPLYARILNEAVEHQNDAGFKAEEYFMHHHDIEISRICTDLAIQHYQLNANQQMDYSDKDVRNAAIHILGDYKLAYVDRKLLELRTSLATVGNDIAKMMDIMKEIKKVEGIRNYLASMVGGNIIK
jgi:DNA primase